MERGGERAALRVIAGWVREPFPGGEGQPAARAQDPGDFAGGGGLVRDEQQHVQADHGVAGRIGQPGRGQVADQEAGLPVQAELGCLPPGQLDAGRGEVDADQGRPGLPGGPQAGPAVPAAQIRDDVSWA